MKGLWNTHLLLCVALLFGTPGCGPKRPETAPVNGKVTIAGQPVTQGKIIFYPEQGRSAIGTIAADGSYHLTTFELNDGALLGKHVVTIQATNVAGPALPASFEEELNQGISGNPVSAPATIEWIVPEKYSRRETTTLKAEVGRESNAVDFHLPAE
jgi:hypothetical protein